MRSTPPGPTALCSERCGAAKAAMGKHTGPLTDLEILVVAAQAYLVSADGGEQRDLIQDRPVGHVFVVAGRVDDSTRLQPASVVSREHGVQS